MDGSPTNDPTNRGLPPVAIELANAEAQKEGIFAGLSSGLASAVIGQRLFGFKRNTTILCGALSGILSGILFTQAFRSSAIARLEVENARLQSQSRMSPENPSVSENPSV
ncbi:hypothetical protein GALMADRAFT_255473 [Galerina marginata CBS 339.88]|uniref:Uncharacterized protein n=1 Tax=Galerina marginata (strain CBS 339.88) TaxID=685588 RepID=A0A067SGL4_GALM3|nr:hypothetical protein GALMADRAFT_255473 [Galerina marginata CBS 339.88]